MDLKAALKYPFSNWKRLLSMWIGVIPFIGGLWLTGYFITIMRSVMNNEEELPPLGSFWETVLNGLLLTVIQFIWLIIIYVVMLILGVLLGPEGSILGIGVVALIGIFIGFPLISIMFAENLNFADGFKLNKALKIVFADYGNYWLMLIYSIILVFVWIIASMPFVTIIITIPALYAASNYLMAVFYRDAKKKAKL